MNRGDESNNTNTPTVFSISWTESAAFIFFQSSVLRKIGGSKIPAKTFFELFVADLIIYHIV